MNKMLPIKAHQRIRVRPDTRCMLVGQYSFEPHDSLGKILRLVGKIDGYPVGIKVPTAMFRNLALHMRDEENQKNKTKKRFNSLEFTYEDGLRVGRYLLDKWVIVENDEVREVYYDDSN